MKQEIFTASAIGTTSAIVRIFETGSAKGDYSEIAVLNDGAGISYGISQFTHRSGSLFDVVSRYLRKGGSAGRPTLAGNLPLLRQRTHAAIVSLAANDSFKKALSATGATPEMREAQESVAFERYMRPAIVACEGSGFTLPLSLAVIYDSMTHGSYHTIRDRVRLSRSGMTPTEFEKRWVTEYVRRRDAWLASIPRLRAARYRTRFFLNQITAGRWHLKLPLNVNGYMLTDKHFDISPASAGNDHAAAGPYPIPSIQKTTLLPLNPPYQPTNHPQARPGVWNASFSRAVGQPERSAQRVLDEIEARIDRAAERFDRIERMTLKAANRTDRAKSLWTTVVGTIWQTGWAVFGTLAGMPREIWLVVAVIAGLLMLFYLYRQIALGRLREGGLPGCGNFCTHGETHS